MKKIYFALGMLLTFGMASAVNVNGTFPKAQALGEMVDVSKLHVEKMNVSTRASESDMLGNYMWIGYGGLVDKNGFFQGDLEVVPGEKTGQCILYGINGLNDVEITADIDAAASTLSIPNRQYIGDMVVDDKGNYGQVYFMHYRWNDAGDGLDEITTPYVLSYEDGVLIADDIDVLGLGVYVDGQCLGYVSLYYMNQMVKRQPTLSNEGWVDAGTATISDDWFVNCPYFSGLTKEPYEVKFQHLEGDENIIRLVDPYGKGTPYEQFNVSSAQGAIYLDLTYPECVIVNRANEQVLGTDGQGNDVTCMIGNYAGLMLPGEAYYPGNFAGSYVEMGFTQEDIMGEIPVEELSYFDKDNNTITLVDALFGISFNVSTLYNGWTEPDQIGSPVITLKYDGGGVEGVEGVEIENAPVKYYNLQGIEVANPVKGQLLIKKQGTKTQKIVVE